MNPVEITAALRTYIRTRFNVPDNDPDFNDDVHLFDYGYVDSFGAVDLTAHVEQQFAIRITESDLVVHPMNSITQIADFVAKRKRGEI